MSRAGSSSGSGDAQSSWMAMKIELEQTRKQQADTAEAIINLQNAFTGLTQALPQEEVERIKNDLNMLTRRASAKQVKLAPLDKFDGNRNKLRGFLAAAQIHLDVNVGLIPNEEAKVQFVAAHFTGNAMDWFEAYLTDWKYTMDDHKNAETRAIFASYDYFKNKLELAFGDVDAERTAERKIGMLKQTKSVGAYISLFQQHAAKIQWDDHSLMAQFHAGLKLEVRRELARMERPRDLVSYFQMAKRIDDNLYMWKLEEKEYQPQRRREDKGDPMILGANAEKKKDPAPPKDKSKITCYNCQKKGHFARECRSKKKEREAPCKPEAPPKKEALAANKEHGSLHWTACDQDECQTHRQLKEATGYWPKGGAHRAAATLEARTKQWIDEQLDESDEDEEMPTPSATQDNETVRAPTPDPAEDWIRGYRRGNTEYELVNVPSEATPAPVKAAQLSHRFHERTSEGQGFLEVYEEWRREAPREKQLGQFKKWLAINKVVEGPQMTSYEWEEALRLVRETELFTGKEVPVKYWIHATRQHVKAFGEAHQPRPRDDPRINKDHMAHFELSWAACIQPTCSLHLTPKERNGVWPRRSDETPITAPLEQTATHGWKVGTVGPDFATLVPGPLIPKECVRGGPWYKCTQNKCPIHVNQKIQTQNWPKGPTLAGVAGRHLLINGRYWGKKVTIMVDSGATRSFVSEEFVKRKGLPVQMLAEPYELQTIEGLAFQKKVTQETKNGWLELPGARRKEKFSVTRLSEDQDIVLGLPWLEKENPQIDWTTKTIRLAPTQGSIEVLAAMAQEASKEEFGEGQVLCQVPKEYQHLMEALKEPKEYVPEHQPWDLEITLKEGTEPQWGPIYRLTEEESDILEKYLDDALKKEWIRESASPAAHPILFVKKKGTKDLRLCVDYRTLNDITIKDRYPLPRIDELQDQLQGATIFTRLDIQNAYHQIRIKEGDEWKTAFRTKFGLFEFLVVPFGLTNAPATFQKRINRVLREHLGKYCMAYLDDILIYSRSEEEHKQHVEAVLRSLTEAKLYLKARKCEFNVTSTIFLGFVVEPGTLRIDPDKLAAIRDWEKPSNVTDVQSFLGFCNFVRKFVSWWSDLTEPLTRLLRKGEEFVWNKEQQKSFEAIKQAFQKEPILRIYDPKKKPIMETDASDFAIAAALFQEDEHGNKFPVAYYARKMTPAERNYDIYDKELLAIVAAFKEWRAYLQGAKFQVTVYSDHKNLTGFMINKELTGRQVRWAQKLATFDFKIIHTKGSENKRADALSRRPGFQETTRPSGAILTRAKDGSIVYNHPVLAATSELGEASWITMIRDATNGIPEELQNLETQEDDGLVRVFQRIYVPQQCRKEFIRQFHENPAHGHQGVERTLERVLAEFYFPKARKQITQVLRDCSDCHRNKPTRHAPYGLLQPTEVPEGPWKTVMMDFIVKLPKSRDHLNKEPYDSIWTITDKLMKYTYFIPWREATTAEQAAETFVDKIIAHHGVPDKIITDRDPKFVSRFWQAVVKRLGIQHALSTAYHPQTDGQSERMNQTVEQYLRAYLNYKQDNWVSLLPMAQFAYNSSIHSMTGVSPFLATYGYEPKAYKTPADFTTWVPTAEERVDKIKRIHDSLKDDALFIQEMMKKYYDKKRSHPPPLEKGEKVWLLRRNIKSRRPNSKLDHVKIGPYEIEEIISPVNYRLKLPMEMKIHPVFHIALLEKAPQDAEPTAYDAQTYGNNEEEWEVERVKSSRMRNGKNYYLIQWSGRDDKGEAWEDTWEPEDNLSPETLQEYWRAQTLAGTQERKPPAPPLPQEGSEARHHEQRCLRRLSRLQQSPAAPAPQDFATPVPHPPPDGVSPGPGPCGGAPPSHEQPPPYYLSPPADQAGSDAAPPSAESVSPDPTPPHREFQLGPISLRSRRRMEDLRSLIGSLPASQELRMPERMQAEHARRFGVSASDTMQASDVRMHREQGITISPLRETRSARFQRSLVLRAGGIECEVRMVWADEEALPLYQPSDGITLGPRALEGEDGVRNQTDEGPEGDLDEDDDGYWLGNEDYDLGPEAYHNMDT